ncbi:unnamed protein product, partial [Polarella glacialis]
VRFADTDAAWEAKTKMDGTLFFGQKLRVELDCTTDFLSKCLVHGINSQAEWQEIHDAFKPFGDIRYVHLHGDWVARVVFESSGQAVNAMKTLSRTKLPGTAVTITVAAPYDGTEDLAEVEVGNLPNGVTEQQLFRYFGRAGKVVSVSLGPQRLPPEFSEP